MNKSSLLHRASSGIKEEDKTKGTIAFGTVESRQAQRDEIAKQMAAWEAMFGAVKTMPIEVRDNISFTYKNLAAKNKALAEAENT